LKTCPRKYKYTIIDGWTHKIRPPALAFGIHLHKILETWHKLLASGMDKPTALLRCVRLAGLLGEDIISGDNTRSKETLIRTTVWYLDQFRDDKAVTVRLKNGEPAVEYSFAFPFERVNGVQTYLCGHIDRLARFQGEVLACDYKTTKSQIDSRFFNKFKPNSQVELYLTATNVLPTQDSVLENPASGLMVDAIQLGVNFTRFQRNVIPYSPEELEDFVEDTVLWLEIAEHYASANKWPANESSCDLYGGCHFRPICQQKPQHRELALRSNFVQRTWDPLRSR